jgi:hypothetical protein
VQTSTAKIETTAGDGCCAIVARHGEIDIAPAPALQPDTVLVVDSA